MVLLSSLKVTADMESSGYVRGATAIEESNKRIAASGQVTSGGIEKLSGQVRLLQQQVAALAAANDNARGSLTGLVGGVRDIGTSFESATANALNTVNQLKLLALGAYALSPAFRSVVNSGIALAIGAIGPAAATATRAVLGFAAPALAFFARLTIPIGIVVAAWQIMNSVINTGSGLLEKYGNAQRALFDSRVDDNLKKLTKFQMDSISLDQVRMATDLGVRLREAKKEISDFFAVSFDLTDPALKLQSVWVSIVETLARGLSILNNIAGSSAGAAQAVGNSSIWNRLGLNWGWQLPGKQRLLGDGNAPEPSRDDLFNQGRQRLIGGMGGGFAGRFSQAINDLATKKEEEKAAGAARSAWDRATESVEKHILTLQAETMTVGQSAGATAAMRGEFQLLQAAKIAGRGVTDDQISQYVALRGAMSSQQALAAAGIALNTKDAASFDRLTAAIRGATEANERAKIGNEILFQRRTAFLTAEDVQIANQLKTVYADIATALGSAEAQALRLNAAFQDFSNTSRDTLKGFASDMRSSLQAGSNAWESFGKAGSNALNKIADKLMNMAIDNLWSNAFGGGSSGGLFGGLASLFGLGGGSSFAGAGASASAINPSMFHSGGVVGASGVATRYVHPAYFDDAPRMHGGGRIDWAAGERPVIGKVGEEVGWPSQLAAKYGGGTVINVSQVNNVSGSGLSKEELMAVMAKNNKDLTKQINASLPDRVAAINRDPRRR